MFTILVHRTETLWCCGACSAMLWLSPLCVGVDVDSRYTGISVLCTLTTPLPRDAAVCEFTKGLHVTKSVVEIELLVVPVVNTARNVTGDLACRA
jgi:hypothetical protein